jgi:hypothetical protein
MKTNPFVAPIAAAVLGAFAAPFFAPSSLRAADHGDAPFVAGDQAADLNDIYFFLDPNDNTQAVLIATFRGFIVAGENANFGIFDPTVRYRFEIETSGDAVPDKFIHVSFNERTADPGPANAPILQVPKAQDATIEFVNFKGSDGKRIRGKFTAPATNPSLAATSPAQVVTDLTGVEGVRFFAGLTDDPFFFDIPAFGRFIGSVRSGSPDASFFTRARDSFAGYNTLAIALRVPVSLLEPGSTNVVGLSVVSQRKVVQRLGKPGRVVKGAGAFKGIDRAGVPAVNVALVPFNRKNEYNASSTRDDARLKFAGDIVGTLLALGTEGVTENGPTGNLLTLAQVAVLNGDILRLNTSLANAGNGGGEGANGFPNGRRLQDDVIDTLLTLIANNAPLGDNVDENDVPFGNTFPFLAPSQQPFPTGTLDDNTRN